MISQPKNQNAADEPQNLKILDSRSYFILLIVTTGLYFSNLYNFLLFHTLAEMFTIIIAYCLFFVALNSQQYAKHSFLLFLGIGYFFIGSMDLLHTLSYKGIGIFQTSDSNNISTQLWIAARYLESITIFLASLLSKKNINTTKIVLSYLLVTIIICLSIFYLKIFPECYIENLGLTTFKKISELLISLILLGTVLILLSKRKNFSQNLFKLILASICLKIASEICFIFYLNVSEPTYLIGYYLKIFSFFLIYKAIVETNLTIPRNTMYKDLMDSEKSLKKNEKFLKNVLESYKDNKDFLNNVLESLTHPFYVIDAKNYEITLANKATFDLYNKDKTTCYGVTHNSNTPCSSSDHPCPLVEIRKTLKPVVLEHTHYDKDNNKRIIEVHGFPLLDEDGNLAQIIEYSFDITNKKKLANRLKENLEFQNKIISESPVGIILFDDNGDCLASNSAAAKMIGGKIDKVLKMNYHQRDSWKNTGLYNNVLKAISEKKTIKYDFIDMTGFDKQVALENIIIPFGKNQVMIMIIDIHERKALEQKLNKSIIEADAANLAKSEFLSNMSHEIRTPMNSILGFSELLGTMVSDPKHKSYLNSIYSSGESLLNIIDDILDLAKIETGKIVIDEKLINLHSMLKEIYQKFLVESSKKKIDFIFEIDPDIPENLFLDILRVEQVLTNVLSNAVKFTETGHIKFYAKQFQNSNKTINLLFSVEDTGIGIELETLKHLFEPFIQNEGHDSKKYSGTGLGLSIAKNLVEMMGGEILTESALGKGSTFSILLKQIKTGKSLSIKNKAALITDNNVYSYIKPNEKKVSKEILSKIPAIIETMENSLMKKWESIIKNHHLPDIEAFAESIKLLGKQYKIRYIIEYGETLMLHLNNFDIERIEDTLKEYHILIKELKKLKE